MIRQILINDRIIEYDLQYKKVKNINLRIKSCESINVSANRRVPERVIEDFLKSKSDFIISVIDKYKLMLIQKPCQHFSEDDLKKLVLSLCEKVYPYYNKMGIYFPIVKFRKMTSRWGTCHTVKGILTFNTNLMFAPKECVEYVVFHEFTHFIVPNHSDKFYSELEKVCPDFKKYRSILKSIIIPQKD